MRVNEIFYSLQGEGYNTGKAAIFIRLAGCNLKCDFCDTEFTSYKELSEEEIAERVSAFPASLVVVTGGEPSLQLTASMVSLLHQAGKTVAVETNGTHALPHNIDWVTLSPKYMFEGDKARVVLQHVDEVKMIFRSSQLFHDTMDEIDADHYFVQPCDTGDDALNAHIQAQCVEFVKTHPKWRLSLQTHKMLNIR